MFLLAEVIGCFVEEYAIYLFMQGFFSEKCVNLNRSIAIYSCFFFVIVGLSIRPEWQYIRLTFGVIGIILIAKWQFEVPFWQAIFAGLGFSGLYVMTEVIAVSLFHAAGINTMMLMSFSVSRAVCVIATHILLMVFTAVVLVVTNQKRSAITPSFFLALTPGYIIGIILGISFCRFAQETGEDMPVIFLIASLGLLYLNILITFYAERVHAAHQRQRELELAEQHYQMQEQYYTQLQSQQNETRAMFHDIGKHLRAMEALLDVHSSQDAAHLLAQTRELFDTLPNVVDVGNPVVSALLNEYIREAEDGEIDFQFDVSVPENLWITAVELYILLGNLLDNAIEASLSIPQSQRTIILKLKLYHNILFCQIENPYGSQHPKRKRGRAHGFGLKNVQRVVEQYQGSLTISDTGSRFSVAFRLNKPE